MGEGNVLKGVDIKLIEQAYPKIAKNFIPSIHDQICQWLINPGQ